MKSKTNFYAVMLFSLVCLLGSSVISCTQAPKAAETPVTAPSDISTMSEDEVCAYIWSQLPPKLPSDCNIAQFSKDTRVATYEGEGKWTFSVSGLETDTQKLPSQIVEKFEDYWVEQQIHEVTTCDLILQAVFYEKTKAVEIVEVRRSNINTKTEVDETPIKKEFELKWVVVSYLSIVFTFEGSIENTGKVPLKNLEVKFFLYDENNNLLTMEQTGVKPDIIAPGERGKIYQKVDVRGMTSKGYYDLLFLTAFGEPFHQSPSLPGENANYYHIGEEKVTRSAVRLEPAQPEDIEKIASRVEATNQLVRNTALLALEGPPSGIDTNSEAWKIWQLNNWVASNINYVSDPKGKEYFAYADETLETKAGDCDDIAVLLASLYEAAGLDAIIALVDTDNITGVDHAACMVYWSEDANTFCSQERDIMHGLGLTSPTGEFYTLYFGSEISEFLIEQKKAYSLYDGIWIVADPIATEVKNMVGYITHRPYTIRSVFNVGN